MTETFPPEPAGGAAPVVNTRWQWRESITRPIRSFQLNYVPVVMVFFAYGALGLIDVTRDLWIKESLSFTPSQLAGIGVWLTLPWTVKMVFGELVDTVPIFGSERKSYILIGALAQLVEQARVLDSDNGLFCEIAYQLNLLVGKRPDLAAE
jgi:hypothetical protein